MNCKSEDCATCQEQECDGLIVNDQPNTCPMDGTRTELLETHDRQTIEVCPRCKNVFTFLWEEEEA